MDLDGTVRQYRRELEPVAAALQQAPTFTLGAPCAVVDAVAGTVEATTLAGLRTCLPTSVALSSAPMERFLSLRDEVGWDRAFAACSSDDAEGEAFVKAWDESQRDLAGGTLVTLNDLVAMVEQAKKGWGETPRELLVVGVNQTEVTSGLVPTDWVLR